MDNFQHLANHINLHDARIEKLTWTQGESRLEMEFDDLWSNWGSPAGIKLPEYRGPLPATITLMGVSSIEFACDPVVGHLNVYDSKVKEIDDGGLEATLGFWPGGKMIVRYRDSICPFLELEPSA